MICVSTVPYEQVKIKLQLSTGKTVTEVVREIGILNIYRGLQATLARDVLFYIFFFVSLFHLFQLHLSRIYQ